MDLSPISTQYLVEPRFINKIKTPRSGVLIILSKTARI